MSVAEVGRSHIVVAADTVPTPSAIKCALMITLVKISLRAAGFDRTIDWIRRHVQHCDIAVPHAQQLAASIERVVAQASAFYPGRALCLEQSLVLYYLSRRRGIGVRYCQGVHAHPFLAHAWVEYDGAPLNDVVEHVREFARLPDLLP